MSGPTFGGRTRVFIGGPGEFVTASMPPVVVSEEGVETMTEITEFIRQPPTLTEFLTARFDEDEAKARAATPGPWATVVPHEWSTPMDGELLVRTAAGGDYWTALITPAGGEHGDDGLQGPDAEHIARHDPARVLADVAAKRRILARESGWTTCREDAPRHVRGMDEGGVYIEVERVRLTGADAVAFAERWYQPTARPSRTLLDLAQPYAEHPDFREEWRA